MTLYIGVDFHPHQQTAAWCDNATGETRTVDLKHDLERVREFYKGFSEGAVIGIEASTKATWFEKMIVETGHKLFVGNPVLIRKRATSRHKNDRRDAELILNLLMRDEFPALWRRPPESTEVIVSSVFARSWCGTGRRPTTGCRHWPTAWECRKEECGPRPFRRCSRQPQWTRHRRFVGNSCSR